MASLGHIAVGVAAGRFFVGSGGMMGDASAPMHPASTAMTRSLALWMVLGVGFSMLPDADVLAFSFGIPYYAPWGHRGATHSLVFAALFGLGLGLVVRGLHRHSGAAFRVGLFAALVMGTHGLLDTLTNGGFGAALLWPFSDERYFAPWRPLPVSPIGLGILSPYGLYVLKTELLVFLPLWLYAFWPRKHRKKSQKSR